MQGNQPWVRTLSRGFLGNTKAKISLKLFPVNSGVFSAVCCVSANQWGKKRRFSVYRRRSAVNARLKSDMVLWNNKRISFFKTPLNFCNQVFNSKRLRLLNFPGPYSIALYWLINHEGEGFLRTVALDGTLWGAPSPGAKVLECNYWWKSFPYQRLFIARCIIMSPSWEEVYCLKWLFSITLFRNFGRNQEN